MENKKQRNSQKHKTYKQKVLFVCTHNSARSQMAEGLLNYLKSDKYEAFSAGTHPSKVNDFAIQALKERGIDISSHHSKHTDKFLNQDIDIVITVCDSAKEECPVFISKLKAKYLHKNFKDPSSVSGTDQDKLNAFKKTRDEIQSWIEKEFF